MPLHHPHQPDRYLRRMVLFVAVSVLALVIGALLGPTPEQVEEFFLHTGREGPLLVLDEIDIIPDNDPVSTPPKDSMAGATQGVDAPVEPLDRPVEDAENPQPARKVRGSPDPSEASENIPLPGSTRSVDRLDQLEQHRASQQTMTFILEKFVRPVYPTAAGSMDRARVVTVWVAMYVNERGKVEHAYIQRSDGGPLFERAVLEAVLQWEYRPFLIDDVPQGFWDQQRVEFVVTDRGIETRLGDRERRS